IRAVRFRWPREVTRRRLVRAGRTATSAATDTATDTAARADTAQALADTALIAALCERLDRSQVHAGDLDRRLYARDASVITGGRTGVVCCPESADQVHDCVRVARA